MDPTQVNTIVTIISIVLTVLAIGSGIAFKDRLFPRLWRKKYIREHNPTPHFDLEMDMRLKGSGIYVQPKIEMEDKGKKKVVKLLRDYFFDEVFVEGTKKDERVFCILGDTGMGKTAALVNLFVDYVNHYRKGNIPYDIWLFSLGDQDVFEKIKDIKDKGNSILLLDAVDENSEAKDDNDYDKFIKKLEQAYQDFAFVVTTCRPQFFGDESEVFDSTNARRNGFFLKCKRLDLVPFDDDQVREYLFNLYYHEPNQKLKQEAEKIVKKCPQIAQRPLVLSYVNELVSDENRNYETTLDIYDAIVKKLIERETKKASPYADVNMIQQWRDLLLEVAGYMYKNGRLIISQKEYENFLSDHNLPDVVNEERKQENVVDKKTFRQRSLLTRTTEGFLFSHKSFYEYFMAYRFFGVPDEIASVQDMDFALRLFDELYDAYKSGKGAEHYGINIVPIDKVTNCLYNIGYELRQLNCFSEAEAKYKNALENYCQLAEDSPVLLLNVAQTLNNLGNLHLDIGQYANTEREYKEALEIYRQLTEVTPTFLMNVAITLNNLGNLHLNIDQYANAEKEYKEALEIYRQLAEKSPEMNQPYVVGALNLNPHHCLAGTLHNLGVFHTYIGKYADAESEFKEALDTYRQLAETSSEAYLPHVATVLNNLGNFHMNTSKHGDAEKEYREALKIQRQLAEASPEAYLPKVAQTLFNISLFRMEQGNLSEAEQMAQESLEKYQTMAKLSPEAFNKDVEDAKELLEKIHTIQADKE